MKETKIKVEGMHCKSCEMLINEELQEMKGVKKVVSNHVDGTVKIEYEGELDIKTVNKKITELGYKVKV